MKLKERIRAFEELGKELLNQVESKSPIFKKAENQTPWFTQENIKLAIEGISHMLKDGKLEKWTSSYSIGSASSKIIGVTMAGNIPLVGFHDYLCILLSGHKAQIKLSSQDELLLPYLHNLLLGIEVGFNNQVEIVERLKGYDAAIATGSNNTSRYFSYYFRQIPHIIRKNKSSVGILIGGETEEELLSLGNDVFTYFGLGCRNVSKIFIPEEYDLIPLLRCWEKFLSLADHNKYGNNYTYQRSIHLMNQKHFYDNGTVLLMEDERVSSPISIVYYEKYKDQEDLKMKLARDEDKIQCIVSAKAWFSGSIAFGHAQKPDVWDYPDQVDTLAFLEKLK